MFDAFLGHFEDVLKELGVPGAKIAEVMRIFHGARSDVLNRQQISCRARSPSCFEWNFVGGFNRRMAVSPDGQRFLLLAFATENADGEAAPSQIVFVQNWFEELPRLVPTN